MVSTRDSRGREALVTSCVSARPYFIATGSRRIVHGADLFQVAKEAGLAWVWNERAVRCLALLGHTVGTDTLHANVYRVPNAAVVTIDNGNYTVTESSFWENVCSPSKRVYIEDAYSALMDAFRKLDLSSAHDGVLSLSAGYDSRLLLALCRHEGLRPRTVTMGTGAATDAVVGQALAKASGLTHQRIELKPEDYVRAAPQIAKATGGAKLANSWHTFLYAREAGAGLHFVGSNGEFARSFYFKRAALARASEMAPSRAISGYFLARMLRRRMRFPRDIGFLRLGVRELLSDLRAPVKRARNAAGLGLALDRFYATERVRHFIGLGLALYSLAGNPQSPFLDPQWVKAAAALPRAWKTNSKYHAYCIERLCPSLMQWPFNGHGRAIVGYSPFGEVCKLPAVKDMIVEASACDALISRSERLRHVESGNVNMIDLLLTLAAAGSCIEA